MPDELLCLRSRYVFYLLKDCVDVGLLESMSSPKMLSLFMGADSVSPKANPNTVWDHVAAMDAVLESKHDWMEARSYILCHCRSSVALYQTLVQWSNGEITLGQRVSLPAKMPGQLEAADEDRKAANQAEQMDTAKAKESKEADENAKEKDKSSEEEEDDWRNFKQMYEYTSVSRRREDEPVSTSSEIAKAVLLPTNAFIGIITKEVEHDVENIIWARYRQQGDAWSNLYIDAKNKK